jgi:hypothetical protein
MVLSKFPVAVLFGNTGLYFYSVSMKQKNRATKNSSFGSSAMLRIAQHPPLSVPSSRKVWLCRDYVFLKLFFFGRPLKHLSQRGDLYPLVELAFRRKILNCIGEF